MIDGGKEEGREQERKLIGGKGKETLTDGNEL